MANSNSNGRASYLDQLKKDLNTYKQKPKESKGGGGSSYSKSTDPFAKYFTPRADKEIFRILPPKSGSKPILEAYFHVMELNSPNGYKQKGRAVYCPAHNNPKVQKKDKDGNVVLDENGSPVMVPSPCPICSKYKKELKKQDQSIRGKKKDELTAEEQLIWDKNLEIFKEAKKYEAKKYYILRGIDKGKMKDGVKFWRFKHNFKSQGALDKMLPILTEYLEMYDVPYYDPEKGTDLSITMVDDSFGGGKTYRAIAAIGHRGPSKLHEDPLLVKEWLNDPITWRDVFKPKSAPNITPYEYLQLLVKGDDPYWDDSDPNNKHWVFPNNPELQEKANQRDLDLDTKGDEDMPMASDLKPDGTAIDESSKYDQHVGSASDDAEEDDDTNATSSEPEKEEPKKGASEKPKKVTPKAEPEESDDDEEDTSNDYDDDDEDLDDLPF